MDQDEILALGEMTTDDEFMPSIRAWQHQNPGGGAPPQHLSEEFQVTTEGLMAVLAFWMSSRKMPKHRKVALELLVGLLKHGLNDADRQAITVARPDAQAHQACAAELGQGGRCFYIWLRRLFIHLAEVGDWHLAEVGDWHLAEADDFTFG